ncbi:glycosyltransferase family 4 protein [Sphingobacterium daejeonense]|uniref:glycosyltransferase family 4 protein n=1 Tax=Sphingobacterium daejeonense TaxID=371142 RepID=UPI0010C5A926|nr:glycosyltransferase family 4 protein [Sphingobacterium daejeonense]VTP90944.1 GDP-mannose-dependent alpha-(1-6)-phosphatidylinositol dimannoside mannosyltransferase [Sphingobacterium daejeonense]
MRILIIHNQYQHIGGEDFVMGQEMEALRKNHEIDLYTVRNQKGSQGYLQYLLYPMNWLEVKKIKQRIQEFKPDLIHIHNMHYALGPLFILHIKKIKIPMVMTLHNFRLICPSATLFHDGNIFLNSIKEDFPWDAVKRKVLENSYLKTFWTAFTYWIHRKRGTFKHIDRFITLSEFSKSIFAKSKFNVSMDKFVVKPNFVKVEAVNKEYPSDYFVYVGRLSEEKGILPLLHAWKATDHKLKIFGTGPLQKEVELIVSNSPNIQYFGFQDKQTLSNNIASATAVIVPSVCYESMPLSVLEAFALGTPVIASSIGILTEMVVPLYTGLLFDPHNHIDLVQKLAEWKSLPAAKIEEIKENCRKEYLEKYSQPIVMDELERIYSDVLAKSKN